MLDRLHITYCLVITVSENKVSNNKWRTFSFNRSAPVLSCSPADARQANEHSVRQSPPSVPEDTVLIPNELSRNSRCLNLNHNLSSMLLFLREPSSHLSILFYFLLLLLLGVGCAGAYTSCLWLKWSQVVILSDFISQLGLHKKDNWLFALAILQFLSSSLPDKHIFRLWEEVGEPLENSLRQREDM